MRIRLHANDTLSTNEARTVGHMFAATSDVHELAAELRQNGHAPGDAAYDEAMRAFNTVWNALNGGHATDVYDAGNGVWFSARPLGSGSWGIRTMTYRSGHLETENLNTTPWPTEAIALQQAERSARGEAEREQLPFRGRARDSYEQESYRGFMINESPGSGFIISKGGVRYGAKPTLEAAKKEVDSYVAQGLGQDASSAEELRARAKAVYEAALRRASDPAARAEAKENYEAALKQIGAKDAGEVRIVYNKLLGGWYIVRGSSDTPISGRFASKEEAQAHLQRQNEARG